ncbi:MAG: hypothetical protein U5K84_06815 [Alkalibacterium sp.]|nr:hypothetical protein [Alkalibacterium sp.]
MNELMKELHELESYEERRAYLEIIWPSIHGTAILTAQGQFDYSDEEIDEKAEHIVTHSLAVWKNSQLA